MRYLLLLLGLVILCLNPQSSSGQQESPPMPPSTHAVLLEIMEAVPCDSAMAIEFMYALYDLRNDLSYYLNRLSDVSLPQCDRSAEADSVVSQLFVSPQSPVEVSSAARPNAPARILPVWSYLDRLTRLDEIYNYASVRISLDPKMTFLGIRKGPYGTVSVATKVVQITHAVTGDGIPYIDYTRKKLDGVVVHNAEGRLIVKIARVSVIETSPLRFDDEDE